MARASNQKLKILYILKLLEKSDETHVVTMKEILGELADHGIQAERKRIYDDLDALRHFGYPIVVKRGRMAGYYLAGTSELVLSPGRAGKEGWTETRRIFEGTLAERERQGSEEKQEEGTWRGSGERQEEGWEWLVSGDTKVELSCEEKTAALILQDLNGRLPVRKKPGKRPGSAILKFKVRPEERFYGWLAGYGCRVRLNGPSAVIKEYRKYLKEIRNLYKEE